MTDVPTRVELEHDLDVAAAAWHSARSRVDQAILDVRAAIHAQVAAEIAYRDAAARYEAERRQAC